MLIPSEERLFMALASDHRPMSLEELSCCVKHNDSKRVVYRRIRLLARDTENSLRALGNPWCIANAVGSSGFVMRSRDSTRAELLASNMRSTQKPKSQAAKPKPKRKAMVLRAGWKCSKPRLYLDPAKAAR